ncbi:hypothetical protein BVC80_1745g23 [Macleaya cordata]|uniref:Uncharacterized protein n=1 Tax=Macleaya cordata TaxID=56857 RepID=A0A200QKJ3_MACCD|nr:hypothetical protein BVC80_1745g23 [Macleaya cordata]
MDFETVKKFILEKLKELLLVLENFGRYLEEKLNTLIPPDVRDSKIYPWLIYVGLPVTMGVLFLILFCWCCKRCCRCCCCSRSRGNYKMMKAPGRDYRMRRSDFESDPRSYFLDLRGKRPKNSSSGDDNMYLRYGLLDP